MALNNRYWFMHNLERHKAKCKNMKGIVDSSTPKLPNVDKQRAKQGQALMTMQKVNDDNARLVVRLAKVFTKGGNLKPGDIGKDKAAIRYRKAKAKEKNASILTAKRAELNRITFDNKLLFNRLLDVPPVINFNDDHFHKTHKRHMQYREETAYYRMKHSPFPIGGACEQMLAPRAKTSCTKSRPSSKMSGKKSRRSSCAASRAESRGESPYTPAGSVFGEEQKGGGDPEWEHPDSYLDKLHVEHLETVLAFKRPPEMVKQLFSTLMVLVSPFDVSFADVSWFAVQQWMNQLGTVKTFLENLRLFDLKMVPSQNVDNALFWMDKNELSAERFKDTSDSLGSLCNWIYATCKERDSAQEVQIQRDTEIRQVDVVWEKAVEGTAAPAVDEAAPAVEEAASAVEEAAPPVEKAAPAAEKEAPAAEKEAPPAVEKEAPPAEKEAPPAEEAAPPAKEASAAVEEASAVVDAPAVEGLDDISRGHSAVSRTSSNITM